MSTKTVRAENLPTAEQIVVEHRGEMKVATAHRVSGGVKLLFAKGGVEMRKGEQVTYTRELPAEGVARCTTEGHGPKAQRPGGTFFCRTCYREQQKAYRQRKGEPAATRLSVKAVERDEKIERLLTIAPKSLTELRDTMLRNVAAAAFYSDEAKVQRLAELARMYGLDTATVAQIVAA